MLVDVRVILSAVVIVVLCGIKLQLRANRYHYLLHQLELYINNQAETNNVYPTDLGPQTNQVKLQLFRLRFERLAIPSSTGNSTSVLHSARAWWDRL